MEESTKKSLKKFVLVICFGVIIYFAIFFIISTGMVLLLLTAIGLSLFGAYTLWEKCAKKELMKKEENLDTLEEEK